jgi:hypothetical protein
MFVKFNEYQGSNRKPLVKAIEGILHMKGEYSLKGTARYAYTFTHEGRAFELDRDGILTADSWLIAQLAEAGFKGEVGGDEVELETDGDTITIEIPKSELMTDDKIQNLLNLVNCRHGLITKALGTPLVINDTGETIQFVYPFYESEDDGLGEIYSQFSYCLLKHARKSSRINGEERGDITSEKFHMRTFLLKIGMIGSEYSACRKWFMRNLSGNPCFATDEKYSEMQETRRNAKAEVACSV